MTDPTDPRFPIPFARLDEIERQARELEAARRAGKPTAAGISLSGSEVLALLRASVPERHPSPLEPRDAFPRPVVVLGAPERDDLEAIDEALGNLSGGLSREELFAGFALAGIAARDEPCDEAVRLAKARAMARGLDLLFAQDDQFRKVAGGRGPASASKAEEPGSTPGLPASLLEQLPAIEKALAERLDEGSARAIRDLLRGGGDPTTAYAYENRRLRRALYWALGEVGVFPPREEGEGAYWWRSELRERCDLPVLREGEQP